MRRIQSLGIELDKLPLEPVLYQLLHSLIHTYMGY